MTGWGEQPLFLNTSTGLLLWIYINTLIDSNSLYQLEALLGLSFFSKLKRAFDGQDFYNLEVYKIMKYWAQWTKSLERLSLDRHEVGFGIYCWCLITIMSYYLNFTFVFWGHLTFLLMVSLSYSYFYTVSEVWVWKWNSENNIGLIDTGLQFYFTSNDIVGRWLIIGTIYIIYSMIREIPGLLRSKYDLFCDMLSMIRELPGLLSNILDLIRYMPTMLFEIIPTGKRMLFSITWDKLSYRACVLFLYFCLIFVIVILKLYKRFRLLGIICLLFVIYIYFLPVLFTGWNLALVFAIFYLSCFSCYIYGRAQDETSIGLPYWAFPSYSPTILKKLIFSGVLLIRYLASWVYLPILVFSCNFSPGFLDYLVVLTISVTLFILSAVSFILAVNCLESDSIRGIIIIRYSVPELCTRLSSVPAIKSLVSTHGFISNMQYSSISIPIFNNYQAIPFVTTETSEQSRRMLNDLYLDVQTRVNVTPDSIPQITLIEGISREAALSILSYLDSHALHLLSPLKGDTGVPPSYFSLQHFRILPYLCKGMANSPYKHLQGKSVVYAFYLASTVPGYPYTSAKGMWQIGSTTNMERRMTNHNQIISRSVRKPEVPLPSPFYDTVRKVGGIHQFNWGTPVILEDHTTKFWKDNPNMKFNELDIAILKQILLVFTQYQVRCYEQAFVSYLRPILPCITPSYDDSHLHTDSLINGGGNIITFTGIFNLGNEEEYEDSEGKFMKRRGNPLHVYGVDGRLLMRAPPQRFVADVYDVDRSHLLDYINHKNHFMYSRSKKIRIRFHDPTKPYKVGSPHDKAYHPVVKPDLRFDLLPYNKILALDKNKVVVQIWENTNQVIDSLITSGQSTNRKQINRICNNKYKILLINGIAQEVLLVDQPLTRGGKKPILLTDMIDRNNKPIFRPSVESVFTYFGVPSNNTNLINYYMAKGVLYRGRYLVRYLEDAHPIKDPQIGDLFSLESNTHIEEIVWGDNI